MFIHSHQIVVQKKSIRVFAPATIGNAGSGFDVIGVALEKPGDVVSARRMREPGLAFSLVNHRGGVDLPADHRNLAAHVGRVMLDELKPKFGIALTLYKQMPVGSGLGSSAASSVAAAVAVNALLPKPLRRRELLRFALEGERLATGSAHADNVAPCLLGGVQLVRSYEPLEVVSLTVSNTIWWVVVHPHLVVRTEEARSVLPKEVPLQTAVAQWGNVAGFVAGLARGDAALVGRCTEDVIVEPYRAELVTGFAEAQQAAFDAGAYGCTLSGSGPSVFAVTDSARAGREIGNAVAAAFGRAAGVKSDIVVSRTNMHGAVVQ